MTVKEKAIELIGKFATEIGISDFHIPKFISGVSMKNKEYGNVLDKETNELAKQCALVVVEEVLYNGRLISTLLFTSQEHGEKYWQEVKTEIQNYDA